MRVCGTLDAGSIPARGTRKEKSKSFGSPRGVYTDEGSARRLICIRFSGQKRIHNFAFWEKKIFNHKTEIRKGKPEDGQNRKVVGLGNLVVGDIATVFEIGFGVHPADDKGPFYTTEIDVVSPYYCEQYLKPPGCIEK